MYSYHPIIKKKNLLVLKKRIKRKSFQFECRRFNLAECFGIKRKKKIIFN